MSFLPGRDMIERFNELAFFRRRIGKAVQTTPVSCSVVYRRPGDQAVAIANGGSILGSMVLAAPGAREG